MGRPNKPNYKLPTSLKKVINFDINNCKQDEKILVVGGGNSAVEYACAVSEFANVTLSYRGGELKRVNNENIQNLLKLSENNKILLKMAIDIEFIENYRGRIKVYFQHGEIKIYDRVVYAIGGTTPINLLKKCGFLLKKLPVYDTNFMSHIKGLYIAGDVAVNGGSIALGLNHSYTIINHIKQKNIF
jgi:thioredoxin reductase (NADPH)